jgi:endonuclease/exonuclease/phosphatase (EEP) superfamily protein YafD
VKYPDRLITLIAVGIATASALPLLANLWWAFDLFSHFRVQYLVLSAVILLLLASRRRWRASLAFLPFVAISTVPVYSNWPSAEPPGSASEQISIMNVNVNSANTDFDALIELIMQEPPDLVFLLEITTAWQNAIAPLAETYPYRIEMPRSGRFGIALLSRIPIIDPESADLLGTPAISARIKHAGQSLRLLGVHLQPPVNRDWSTARNQQLAEIGKLLDDRTEPVMIVGDFNITTYSPIFSAWLAANGLRSTAQAAGPTISWPTFLPLLGILIDHYAFSGDIRIHTFRRGSAFGSDHYPLTATFSLRGTQ